MSRTTRKRRTSAQISNDRARGTEFKDYYAEQARDSREAGAVDVVRAGIQFAAEDAAQADRAAPPMRDALKVTPTPSIRAVLDHIDPIALAQAERAIAAAGAA